MGVTEMRTAILFLGLLTIVLLNCSIIHGVRRIPRSKILRVSSTLSSLSAFQESCYAIIQASKNKEHETVRQILKKYRKIADERHILGMHSCINAARCNDVELVQMLVEAGDVEIGAHNDILLKTARKYGSGNVAKFIEELKLEKREESVAENEEKARKALKVPRRPKVAHE